MRSLALCLGLAQNKFCIISYSDKFWTYSKWQIEEANFSPLHWKIYRFTFLPNHISEIECQVQIFWYLRWSLCRRQGLLNSVDLLYVWKNKRATGDLQLDNNVRQMNKSVISSVSLQEKQKSVRSDCSGFLSTGHGSEPWAAALERLPTDKRTSRVPSRSHSYDSPRSLFCFIYYWYIHFLCEIWTMNLFGLDQRGKCI